MSGASGATGTTGAAGTTSTTGAAGTTSTTGTTGVQVGRSGRVRPQGDRRELAIWYLMRFSGLGLFVLVLTHYLILHVLYDPAEQDAGWIAEMRWSSTFWRVFDWLMLTLVMFHAFVGMRIVVGDVTGGPVRRVLLWALYALAILLFVLGTIVVVSLPNVVPAG